MNKTITFISLSLITCLLTIPVVFSDNDREAYRQKSLGVAAVTSGIYNTECGSCHMVYPPGLLPAASWQKIMSSLESHFGDNAEIDAESFKSITEFLVENSADQSDYRRSRKIMRSLSEGTPSIRITELPYIKHEHDELPEKMIKYNPDVGSLSHCTACHAEAEKGLFNEHTVRIPGYGKWDD